MKLRSAILLAAPLALAACGSSDNAATEAEADTVEIPANEALQTVEEAPVADPNANAVAPAAPTGTATPEVTEEERIQAAGDSAADTAAAAADAAAETQTEAEGQ